MKRRRFVKAMIAAPAVPALIAQQAPAPENRPGPTSPAPPPANPQQPPDPLNRTPPAGAEAPKLETAIADDAGEMMPRFFTADQFPALRKLSEIIMPAINGAPGALEAHAPEFLDFLIGESPKERRQLYQAGLDALNAAAKKKFNRPFAQLEAGEAATLLGPLREPWTFEPPADPLGHFLRDVKQDIRTATMNSREYSMASGGGRRAGGVGLYWYPLD